MKYAPTPPPLFPAFKSPRKRSDLGDYTTADSRVILLSLYAIPIGAFGAVIAWILVRLIGLITNLSFYHTFSFAFTFPTHETAGWTVFIPTIVGGLVIGLMCRYGSEQLRGHGIPEAIESILLNHSIIKPRVAILKPIASALAIGTGGPFGAEGPIIMTGGAFGSIFAQLFKLSAMERKTLMIAGACAGMAGIFDTPIAAALFGIELLLFELRPRSFIPVGVACSIATILRPQLLGSGPLFPYNSGVMPLEGLLICIPVGITAGILSGILTWLTYFFEDSFDKLHIHWMWWPAIGGVLIGIASFIDPAALGVGYNTIRELLAGNLGFTAVVTLLIVKSLLWSSTLGSGTSGGVLAPLLIMGGAMGSIEAHIIPVGDPTLWALVGMTATLGGTMRSPFTCIVFALELTRDMNAALPLVIATFMAVAFTVLVLKRSVLTEKISRRHHHVTREYSTDPLETMFAEDHMTRGAPLLLDTMDLGQAIRLMENYRSSKFVDRNCIDVCGQGMPVVDDQQKAVGTLTLTDALRIQKDAGSSHLLVGDVATKPCTFGYPGEPMSGIADRMAKLDVGCVPIIDPESQTLVGIVTRHDVLRARGRAVSAEIDRTAILRRRHPCDEPENVPVTESSLEPLSNNDNHVEA